MLSAFPHAMPLEGFVGGLMIGLAAAIMLLVLGRIAGISGLVARGVGLSGGNMPKAIAFAFVIGLPIGAYLLAIFAGPISTRFPAELWQLILGGLIVGFGTRLGSGCTSGHGVCGMSRLSLRSLLATALFMASGFATVAVMRLAGVL